MVDIRQETLDEESSESKGQLKTCVIGTMINR